MSTLFAPTAAGGRGCSLKAIGYAALPSAGWRRRAVAVALVAILLLGLALRVAASRGDLWIDEVWTLSLLSNLTSPGEIFWNVSHDNNHFLNSLWMYFVGLDAEPWVYRLPSIAEGGLSVLVAARIGFRSGGTAGLVCAFAFAISYPMVNFGSEARGYSGLVLSVLLMVDALDLALPLLAAEPRSSDLRRHRLQLGTAIGFGMLSHLVMVCAAGAVGVMALWVIARQTPRLRPVVVLRRMSGLFWPSLVFMAPAAAAVAAGMVVKHGITIGGLSHAPHRFVTGYGGMLGATLGLPSSTKPLLCMAATLAITGLALETGLLARHRGVLIVVAVLLMPGLADLADLPNTDYPRYFLCCGVVLTLSLAEAVGRALARSREAVHRAAGELDVSRKPARYDRYRALGAGSLLLAFTLGQVLLDQRLLVWGRGNVSSLVSLMTATPDQAYSSTFSTAFQLSLDYQAYRHGATLRRVPMSWTCDAPPDWYILDAPPDGPRSTDRLDLGPQACLSSFAMSADAPTSPLSGRHWTLYRRVVDQR